MVDKCSVCGFEALIKDDGYLVCKECSTIQSEDLISFENQDAVGYAHASENLFFMSDKQKIFQTYTRVPEGKASGQWTIQKYGELFSFTPDMVEHAEDMYKTLFHDPDVVRKFIDTKNFLSLGCLFFVGRKNNKIVSIKNFCKVAPVPVPKLVEAVKIIETKLSLELPKKGIVEITVEIVNQHKIRGAIVPKILEILSLCDKAWLLTGRQPQKFIWAAIFIAHKSSNMAELQKLTYPQFVKKYENKKYHSEDGKRLKEILTILTDLGHHVPWASHKGDKHFVYHNLQDIIKYSELSIMEKRRKLLESMEMEKLCESNEFPGQKRKLDNVGDVDIFQPPAAQKYRKPSNVEEVSDTTQAYLNLHLDDDIENLGSDIDKELDAYIRSDKEVLEIEKARALIIDGNGQ